ncbi:PAS domain-containing protein [Pseudoduganella sp. FT93W]|uniref:histidine kinase n=1 Tax=Duganella fentianensis TaxID=2692177 RepID=A0A845HYQ4_9BURK|nr:ATP-binding protein [Duganella fentianensis]MYN46022.1 PAS domain-containing protein [Duganella fentianensis]
MTDRPAQPSTPPSVRRVLTLLVAACIVPIVLVLAVLMINFYRKEEARLIDNTLSHARHISTAADREVRSTQLALQVLAGSHLLQDRDLRAFHARIGAVVDKLHVDSILLIDLDGRILLSSLRPYGSPLAQLSDTPLLQQTRNSGQPGVSGIFTGPLTRQPIITIAVPVIEHGKVVMSLNATVTPATLQPLLFEQKTPDSWRAGIVDQQYRIITRSHDMAKLAGQQLPAELRQPLSRVNESMFESYTLEGRRSLFVYQRSEQTGWTSILCIPHDELTAPLRRSLFWLITLSVITLALGISCALWLARRVTRSIHALIAPALAVGQAVPLPLPRLYFREARELAQALQIAARDLQRARAESSESEQRLALAARAAHLGIWTRDLRQQHIWVSQAWRELFGFSDSAPLTLEDLLARVHPADRQHVQRTLDSTLFGATRYDMEFRIELPSGCQRWISSHGSVEFDRHQRPTLVRGVSLDITSRKQAELDLQQKQKEVTHLARVAMLGELSGALAHELNQPLTAILSNAQAAQRFLSQPAPDLPEVQEILNDIVTEDQRAGAIIARLRALFGKHDAQRQRISAQSLIDSVLHLISNDLIHQRLTLRTALCAETLTLEADPVQLQQVLLNLLMNACDAQSQQLEHSNVIELRSTHVGHTLQLSISDSGGGIPPAALDQIFTPFYTTKARGMGLGLSICRSIVDAHGGRLWAENNGHGGATFHLRLPLAEVSQP